MVRKKIDFEHVKNLTESKILITKDQFEDFNINGEILIHLEDRAGNESNYYYYYNGTTDSLVEKNGKDPKSTKIVWDNTSPNVNFDLRSNNKKATTYNSHSVTASIKVIEDHLRDLKITVYKTEMGGTKAKKTDITKAVKKNGNNYTYTFKKEGKYTIVVNCKDYANNSGTFKSEYFIIDKTKPEVTVKYDNNDVRNGKFFKANRTATITIKDYSFDKSLVKLSGKGYTEVKNWTNKGNGVYQKKVYFAIDEDKSGVFSFGISCKDKAGNKGNISYQGKAPKNFMIDKVYPTAFIPTAFMNYLEIDKWENHRPINGFSLFNKSPNGIYGTIIGTDNYKTTTIGYYISSRNMTSAQLTKLKDEEWSAYKNSFYLPPTSESIVYAKVTDKAGNSIFINSDGIILDSYKAEINAKINTAKSKDGIGNSYCYNR